MKQNQFLTETERFEYLNSKIIYNGEVCTLSEARSRKAAKKRKENAMRNKKRQLFLNRDLAPKLNSLIKKTRKSVRNLKSISAFVRNGPVQWSKDFKELNILFPNIINVLNEYNSLYLEICDIADQLNALIDSNKANKKFFDLARDFGYKMLNLLNYIEKLSKVISDTGICSSPLYNSEIVCGSKDGRRVGLNHIISNTYSTKKETLKNLIELNNAIEKSYEAYIEI